MHATQQVVEAIAQRLIGGGTSAGARVHLDRDFPLGEGQLPCFCVYVGNEAITPDTVHYPALRRHDAQINLVGYSAATTRIDAALQALRTEATYALFSTLSHATLGGLVKTMHETKATPSIVERGEIQLGALNQQIECTYYTAADAPEVLL